MHWLAPIAFSLPDGKGRSEAPRPAIQHLGSRRREAGLPSACLSSLNNRVWGVSPSCKPGCKETRSEPSKGLLHPIRRRRFMETYYVDR